MYTSYNVFLNHRACVCYMSVTKHIDLPFQVTSCCRSVKYNRKLTCNHIYNITDSDLLISKKGWFKLPTVLEPKFLMPSNFNRCHIDMTQERDSNNTCY